MNASIKNRGRKRHLAGSTLLTLSVLTAAVWWASRWWSFERADVPRYLLAHGALFRQRIAIGQVGWFVRPLEGETHYLLWRAPTKYYGGTDLLYDRWLFSYGSGKFPPACWTIVLWPFPPLLFAVSGLLLWPDIRAKFRSLSGKCPVCGYNLTGIARTALCPECGTSSHQRNATVVP